MDRLEKQPTDLRRRHHYMRDGALTRSQLSQRSSRSQIAPYPSQRHPLGFRNEAKTDPNTDCTKNGIQYKSPNAAERIQQAQEGERHHKITEPIRHGGYACRLTAHVERKNL